MKVFIIFALIAVTLAEPPSYRHQALQKDRTYYFAKQQEAENPEFEAPYAPSGWKPDGPALEYPQRQQSQQQNAPAVPQQEYGVPAPRPIIPIASQTQYGAPAAPEKQYGAPTAPQREFYQSQKQFRVPQQQYAAPQLQSNVPQQQSNIPQQYGAPQFGTESSTTADFEDHTTFPSSTESQAEPVNSVNELDEEEGNVNEQQQKQSGQYFIALPDGRLQRVQYISRQDLEAMKYFAKIRAENVEPLRGPIYAYQPLQKLEFAPTQLEVISAESVIPISTFGLRENNNAKNLKATDPSTPNKLEAKPIAAEVPSAALTSFTSANANFQSPKEQRFLITF